MSVKGDGATVKNRLKELTSTRILVGIPQKTARRQGEPITNAELMYIHTNGVRAWAMRMYMGVKMIKGASYPEALQMYLHSKGSPQWQIPPRPVIEPAITAKGNKEKITSEMEAAGKAALNGNRTAMRYFMERAGITAVNLVKAWFTDPRNGWAPNSPSTIKRKGSSKPLIDTAQMRNAITYILDKIR